METGTKTGLILGKFAPFHYGHQHLLEFAKSRVDKLYVLIYDAKDTTDIPLFVRANWIKKIYPSVIVVEGYNGPTQTGDTEEIKKIQEDYILRMIPEKITHFFSSEWYGEHVSKALGAENVIVDMDRSTVPVSATKIRTGVVRTNEFLHPIVNRDVVKKVVFVGAESTGKTTLANAMAEKFGTICVNEYGREYWNENHDKNGKLSADQLVELANRHRINEEFGFRKSNRICFIDTCASTTKQYCKDYGHPVPAELESLVQIEKYRYDLFILCDIDIPYEDDGTRRGEDIRLETQIKIASNLTSRDIRFHLVSGNLDDRIKEVSSLISFHLDIY